MARDFVYFVTYENGPIKIGKAKNISNRIKGLQTSIPSKIDLLGVMAGPHNLESSLHKQFSSQRISGEWFEKKDPLVSFIEKHACDPSFSFYKGDYDLLKTENRNLRKMLEDKNMKIENSIKQQVSDSVKDEFSEKIAYVLEDMFECQKTIVDVLRDIERESGFKVSDRVVINFRKVVDLILGTKWQESERLLGEGHLRDGFAKARANKMINDLLELEIHKFEQKRNRKIQQRIIDKRWIYQVGEKAVREGLDGRR